MSFSNKFLIIVLTIMITNYSFASNIIVIVNKNSPIKNVSKEDLKQIFLGERNKINNHTVTHIIEKADPDQKNKFHMKITGKNYIQLNTHWARMIFTGSAKRPIEVFSDNQAELEVSKNTNAIAYISKKQSQKLNSKVRIIYEIK